MIDLKSYKEKQCNLLGDSNFLQQKNIVLKQELTEIKLGITPHQHRRWTKIYVITEDLGLDKSRAKIQFLDMAENIIVFKAENGFKKEDKTGNKTWKLRMCSRYTG